MLTTFLTRTPLVYKGQADITHGVSASIVNGISQNRISDTGDSVIQTTSLGFLIYLSAFFSFTVPRALPDDRREPKLEGFTGLCYFTH